MVPPLIQNSASRCGSDDDFGHNLIVLAAPVDLVDVLHDVLGLQDVQAPAVGMLLLSFHSVVIPPSNS